ncbi:MAG: hypothetical protein IJW70_11655 [Clostridia bacterium]|nr:hypothetical protein [Clostridia bacterium]
MTFSLFSVTIIVIFIVILSIEVYNGVQKGFRRAMVSLGSVLASVIASVMLSPLLSMLLTQIVFNLIVSKISVYRQLIDVFPSADELIRAVCSALVSTVLFVGVFLFLRGMIDLAVAILCRVTQRSDAKDPGYRVEKNSYFDKNSKVLGGITGGICAIVVAMVITSPIMGSFDVANRIVESVEKVNSKAVIRAIGEKNTQSIKTYSHDVSGNVLYQFGGKLMYQSAASTYMYGGKVSLLHEIETAEKTVEDGMALYKAMTDPHSNAKTRVALLDALCADVEQYRMCHGVAAEVMSKGASAWRNGEKFFGISKPSVNKLAAPAIDDVLDACAKTDIESVKPNIITMIKIAAVMIDCDFIFLDTDDYEEVMEILADGVFVDKVNALLKENPNMSDISVSSLAMTVVADHLLISEYDAEKYSVLVSGLADAVNTVHVKGYGSDDERAQALATHAVKQLEEYGMPISLDVAKMTAKQLLSELPLDQGSITEDHVREIFDRYANP